MALYAIADLHLSLGEEKPMDIFRGWTNYIDRLTRNWTALVQPADTVVVAGDVSWAMSLDGARTDFAFLDRLPGRKLLLKGNHDYWWNTRRKMDAFLAEQGFDSIRILHNSAERYGPWALCGSRGWFFDAEADADKKVLLREVGRLQASIDAGRALGGEPLAFLHYPPVTAAARCDEMMDALHRNGITRCWYGHLHGPSIRRAVQGVVEGIEFRLVSCDAADFTPVRIA